MPRCIVDLRCYNQHSIYLHQTAKMILISTLLPRLVECLSRPNCQDDLNVYLYQTAKMIWISTKQWEAIIISKLMRWNFHSVSANETALSHWWTDIFPYLTVCRKGLHNYNYSISASYLFQKSIMLSGFAVSFSAPSSKKCNHFFLDCKSTWVSQNLPLYLVTLDFLSILILDV